MSEISTRWRSDPRLLALAGGLCAWLVAASGLAVAQGERERAPVARVVDPRAPELAEDPSAFASVVELDDYAGEAKSTEDLLSRAVGVQVRRFGGPGQRSEISIRGSTGAQVVVLLDGVRLNNALGGGLDLSTLPPGLLERIEIQRGGGSVQAGSGGIGGVVNLITRRPGAEPQTRVRFAPASFGTMAGGVSHARRVGPLGLVVGYDGFRTEGDWHFQSSELVSSAFVIPSREYERLNNRSEHHATLLKLDARTPGGLRVKGSNHFFYQSRGQPGFANGGGPLGGQNVTAHERVARNVAALSVESGSETRWLLRGSHRFERTHYTDPAPLRAGGAVYIEQRQTGLQADGQIEGAAAFAGGEHLWALAGVLVRDSLVSNTFGFVDRWNAALRVGDEVAFFDGRLRLAPALRMQWTERFGTEWLPRLGIVVEPRAWDWLRVKVNVERSFRVPSFDELFHPDEGFLRGNAALLPEEAVNFDAGVELATAKLGPFGSAGVELNWFRNDIGRTIVFTQINLTTTAPLNIEDVLVDGIELAGRLELGPWLRLSANYTRLWTRVEGGGELPGRARSEATIRLEASPESQLWKIASEWHHVSQIPLTLASSGGSFVAARATWDASVSLDLARLFGSLAGEQGAAPRSLRLGLVGTNLGDISVQDARGLPQPGRSLTLEIEARW